jgi:hypothetical protein
MTFELSFDNEAIYCLLVDVCQAYGIYPSASLESEDFFRELLTHYPGEPDLTNLTSWLEEQIPKHFVAVGERPKWIQEPEWPIVHGEPMIFAGQIDLSTQGGIVSELYHDDTSLYVFVGRKTPPVVIVQQF